MSTAEQREFFTPESYLTFLESSDTKFEYVDGSVRAMSSPTNRHNRIATNVLGIFWTKLKGSTCFALNSNSLVRIRQNDSQWLYFSDASIVCESNSQSDRFQDRPVVVVEILSPTTRAIDLDEKVENYLMIDSLQAYLILEQDLAKAILYRRSSAGFIRESVHGSDQSIPLPPFEWSVSLAEIYSGVEFPPPAAREVSPDYALP